MSPTGLARENIRQLVAYASARSEFKGTAEVWLDANENPFDTGYNRYPDPLQHEVKARISDLKGIAPSHIFLGNGSDEAIDLLIRIFCEPRIDHILILPPTYGMYKVSADIADVAIKTVSLTPDFQPDVAAIHAASDAHSKLLFICSPNNPTGNLIDRERIIDILAHFPGIVVVDEAYIDFASGSSCIGLIEQYPRLVVMQTFSKAWGLAGIRLGMAFAAPEIIHLFNKVKPPYNVNQLTQRAALEALISDATMQTRVQHLIAERERVRTALESSSIVEHVFDSDANFLLARTRQADELYRFLIEQKIVVRNRSRVPMCEGCLRFTIGTAAENQRLLAGISKFEKITTSDL